MASSAQVLFDPYGPLPTTKDGMPIFYEDEEEGDMGESNPHTDAGGILHICLKAHLAPRPSYRVFLNMNCYYLDGPPHPITGSLPYVSPDIMVVRPARDLGEQVSSYTIGRDGPAPLFAAEVLSARSAQQRDLREKLTIYGRLRIAEYLLANPSGRFLPQRLLLKRLRRNLSWKDEQDADGGVTSRLGFRVILDGDDRLRVLNAATGERYARPDEAQAMADEVRALKADLARLRSAKPKETKGKRRRRKS
jgi:Uma2 family endonuclease